MCRKIRKSVDRLIDYGSETMFEGSKHFSCFECFERDFRLASRKFWHTIRRLRKGKQGLAQAVLSREDTDLGYCQAVERTL